MTSSDPYVRLRPTPLDESCVCEDQPPIILRSILAPNPLACFQCNREVPPERIGFPSSVADAIAHWTAFHDCFYFLWLDSGEFEAWAQAQLEDPNSPVNRRGLEVIADLTTYRKCYLWWFGTCDEDYVAPAVCRICESNLQNVSLGLACESCQIIFAP